MDKKFRPYFATLKNSTKKLYFSNLNEIKQDDCCDPVINVNKNNKNLPWGFRKRRFTCTYYLLN